LKNVFNKNLVRVMLATGLAENFTQVVFHQPFVIQHVRSLITRLSNCETWNSWCIYITSTWNQFV